MKVLPASAREQKIHMDKKDKEILSVLCTNSRLPTAKIGHVVGLSRESVEYRIRKLEEEHVLAGSIAVVNVRKLKNFSFHVFISLHNPSDEEILIKRAKENTDVNSLIKYSGKWDFELSIMTSTHERFQEIYNKMTKGIGIQDESILVLLNMIKGSVLPKKFLSSIKEFDIKKNNLSFFKDFNKAKKDTYRIDEIDLKILKSLSKDAQMKIKDLASSVRLSADTVTYRIKKLIENNYIIEFRPVVDFSKLNLSIEAMLLKTQSLTKEEETRLNNFLKENDSVLWATKTFGSWNILLYTITESQDEFHAFINELMRSFSSLIKNYEVLFAYQQHKYQFLSDGLEIER